MSNISFSVFVGRNAWALAALANVEGQAPYIIRTLYSNTGHGQIYRLGGSWWWWWWWQQSVVSQSQVRVAAERDAIEGGSFVDRLWALDALDCVLRHFDLNLVVLLVMPACV